MCDDIGYIPPNDKLLNLIRKVIDQNGEILEFNQTLLEMMGQPAISNQVVTYRLGSENIGDEG